MKVSPSKKENANLNIVLLVMVNIAML